MKSRMMVSILIIILALLLITSCATTSRIQERGDVNQKVFFRTVQSGDYVEVKRLIDAGADVHAIGNNGYSALMLASYEGHTMIARLLIEAGTDVDTQDELGYTALMIALALGHTDVAEMLIKAGADVNARVKGEEYKGVTALWLASTQGYQEVVKLLIEAEADVNARDNEMWTALMIASYYGHPEVANLLIKAGADVNADLNDGFTSLMLAAYHGHPEVAKLLIDAGEDVKARTNFGCTALMKASETGQQEIALVLIKAGADINAQDNKGRTALMWASYYGHSGVVRLLRGKGADENAQDNEGRTAFAYSIFSAFSEMKVKANVEDCKKILDNEWKEGANKVVVRTVDIDFAGIEVDYTISHSEKKYYNEKNFTEDQIRQSKKYSAYQQVLWDTFANKCEEDQFSHITTENWHKKWSYYKSKLIEKANKFGFHGDLLSKCIEKIEPNPTDKTALLPVGAYLARNGIEKVWIIICKWEYAREYERDDGTKGFHSLGHIRGWAVKEENQKKIAFFTCM